MTTIRAVVDHPAAWAPVECTTDPELFFRDSRAAVHAAQEICQRCPLLVRCAQYALAAPDEATDGVFASVLMASTPTARQDREAALELLAQVAKTGIPAPLHDFGPAKFAGTRAELLQRVVELRDEQGMSWSAIGKELGCHYMTARNMYESRAASLSKAVA
ncbi:WhiB family transcriptional regulator [Nocardia sp. 852002-20019_SCH5090214]|uniref:WhiB family transcriptional regulator n=1 Tax=Nocardia sp. 852002-20019_SCH5090214 TaxID=1834087 RepID=UPI0009EEC8A0|nr:WhiB family transcriptional regulator [Nocardia sp. 852002-20019_SCH5090214]